MQINLNTNISNQSFTAFKMDVLAEENLRKVIKPKDFEIFENIVDSQASNPVTIRLFGEKYGKLSGRIITYCDYVEDKELAQLPLFESALRFLKRLADTADKMKNKINNMPNINIDTIFNKMKD